MRLYSANEPRRYVRRVRYLCPGGENVRLHITVDRPMPCALSCNGSERNNWEGQCAILFLVDQETRRYNMELVSQPQMNYTGPHPGSPEQIRLITVELRRLYPAAKCTLDFSNPLELLVAPQLAAQCTDDHANIVTPPLF